MKKNVKNNKDYKMAQLVPRFTSTSCSLEKVEASTFVFNGVLLVNHSAQDIPYYGQEKCVYYDRDTHYRLANIKLTEVPGTYTDICLKSPCLDVSCKFTHQTTVIKLATFTVHTGVHVGYEKSYHLKLGGRIWDMKTINLLYCDESVLIFSAHTNLVIYNRKTNVWINRTEHVSQLYGVQHFGSYLLMFCNPQRRSKIHHRVLCINQYWNMTGEHEYQQVYVSPTEEYNPVSCSYIKEGSSEDAKMYELFYNHTHIKLFSFEYSISKNAEDGMTDCIRDVTLLLKLQHNLHLASRHDLVFQIQPGRNKAYIRSMNQIYLLTFPILAFKKIHHSSNFSKVL